VPLAELQGRRRSLLAARYEGPWRPPLRGGPVDSRGDCGMGVVRFDGSPAGQSWRRPGPSFRSYVCRLKCLRTLPRASG